MSKRLTLWFVTDIHGSDLCFRKFLMSPQSRKAPDVIVLGGDITGKWLVPVVEKVAGRWNANFGGEAVDIAGEADLRRYEQRLADVGVYTYRCDEESADRLVHDADFAEDVLRDRRLKRLERWLDWAEQCSTANLARVIVNAGNDDPFYIDEILGRSGAIVVPEGRMLEIGGDITMISSGYANMTPWRCARDVEENVLATKIASMAALVPDMSRCIFNLHCPPYGTPLDLAPSIDAETVREMSLGPDERHVGSHAVRDSIEKYSPAVGLHGHIHEQHAFVRLGATICFNPGSEYERGLLQGVYLLFEDGRLRHYALTRELGG